MPVGRLVVLATLPLLLALGVLQGEVRSTITPSGATEGLGSFVVRVSADGRPSVIHITAPALTAERAAVPAAEPRRRPGEVRHLERTAPAPVRVPQTPRPAAKVVDTYPWARDTSGDPDPWGFTKRQCVSYVAYRLAEAGRPLDNGGDHWGSALDWDDTARRLGFPVTSKPAVGAVAHWDAGEVSDYWSAGRTRPNGTFTAGWAGHVAWVTRVYADGSVQVAQYNGAGERSFSTMRVDAPRYLRL